MTTGANGNVVAKYENFRNEATLKIEEASKRIGVLDRLMNDLKHELELAYLSDEEILAKGKEFQSLLKERRQMKDKIDILRCIEKMQPLEQKGNTTFLKFIPSQEEGEEELRLKKMIARLEHSGEKDPHTVKMLGELKASYQKIVDTKNFHSNRVYVKRAV